MSTTRNTARGAGVVGAVAALFIGSAGSAFAHECFPANRSAQGNASVAAHSAAWTSFTLDDVLRQFIGLTDEDLIACVEAGAPAAGVPSLFVVGDKQAQGSDGVIMNNNPNLDSKAADGKGIDHAEDAFVPLIGALIGQCSA
jgi:hypothetical protein